MTDLDDLRAELDAFAQPVKKKSLSAREERIIAGFEEIQRFVEQHGRAPQHGEGRDIFERLYSVRLDRLRALEECRELLTPLDHQGLLSGGDVSDEESLEAMDDDTLLAELAGAAGSARPSPRGAAGNSAGSTLAAMASLLRSVAWTRCPS